VSEEKEGLETLGVIQRELLKVTQLARVTTAVVGNSAEGKRFFSLDK
jgi:hypothetical protein